VAPCPQSPGSFAKRICEKPTRDLLPERVLGTSPKDGFACAPTPRQAFTTQVTTDGRAVCALPDGRAFFDTPTLIAGLKGPGRSPATPTEFLLPHALGLVDWRTHWRGQSPLNGTAGISECWRECGAMTDLRHRPIELSDQEEQASTSAPVIEASRARCRS